ncbi:MAG: NAD(P)H-dependent oxidoreductase subunit E, partial [Hyphomicrobium sp.]|nr:NAD(P)H-dependent oxidoreductase subunit E [Hyphomicrobium sp.]
RGARALVEVCQRRIAEHAHDLNGDGSLSWEEVECLGNCANAPMVQIDKDTFEDLTPALLERVIDSVVMGKPLPAGSQIGRTASCPEGGPTTLLESSLFDGSTVGAWRRRFAETEAVAAATPVAPTPVADTALTRPAILPAALAAMANAGLVKELEARGTGTPLSPDDLQRLKLEVSRIQPVQNSAGAAPLKPELLTEPRDGKPDDLGLIWGVADKLADKLNAMGIWHFDQIAKWTPAHLAWFEAEMAGFKGRVMRDKWIEQCEKLATGWRPTSDAGERPKE